MGTLANQYEHFSAELNTSVSCGAGTLLGINSSGKAVLATITSGTFVLARGMALTSGTAGDRITLFRQGRVNGFAGLTVGSSLYNAGTGNYTQTAPTTPGQLLQTVGFAISASEIVLHIDDARVIKDESV
ncbi:MAG: hypothetical protein WC479_05840 [Candidatus Izemoplasmatales bacterium]